MLTLTKKGLYCAAGNFYIDPNGAVENAVVTHAHSDHARRGAQTYYSTRTGADLVRSRLGKSINIKSFDYRDSFSIGGVKLSFHPAGHILGSAQVRLEHAGEVWVASGDYKREFDPTCEAFESVECDVFITEATFGTPGYTWQKDRDLASEIIEWWTQNKKSGKNSVLFAYSLGKTQRILGILEPYLKKQPVYCHSAAADLNSCYRRHGIRLAETICLSELEEDTRLSGELIIAPQAFLKSPQVSILNENFETAFASGWMARQSPYGEGYDKGFLMSDHADWNDLILTIQQSKAKKVFVQHRGHGALVRHLRKLGLQAFPESELTVKNPDQLSFF